MRVHVWDIRERREKFWREGTMDTCGGAGTMQRRKEAWAVQAIATPQQDSFCFRLLSVNDLEEFASCEIREDKAHVTDQFCSSNKRILDEVATVPSKRLRNKIAGCESI